jgi:NAD dependent epimerase/dehydratase family enzyme
MIDNIELIRPLLNFSEHGDFYMLYVLKRKKDQPEGEKDNHQSVRTIKSYCVESIEYLEKRYDEIKQLCEMFKARAYIHVQKQNHRDVSLNMMVALAQRIQDGNHKQQGLFDSVVGQLKTYEKRWITDIDTKDKNFVEEVATFINTKCRPIQDKIISVIPTKNGYHLITDRFDSMEFKKQYPNLDLQKRNPSLLFLPDSLS